MNFDGYTPYPIERFSSLVEMDDATNLPLGVSPLVRNVKFRLTRVATRDGIQNQYGLTLPEEAPVTGLAALKVGGPTGDLQVPVAFSALGNLYRESPVGSGRVVPIAGPLVTLPINASMQVAPAFAKGFFAFGDLKNSLGLPAVYNPQLNTLDPCSMLPVGQGWAADTEYYLGECVTPSSPVGGNGRLYQCTQAGRSDVAQPNFPAVNAGPNLAGAGANVSVGGIGGEAWTNPGNLNQTDGVTFATCNITGGSGDYTQNLQATAFGFALPVGAVVKGVKVVLTADIADASPGGTLYLSLSPNTWTTFSFVPSKAITLNPADGPSSFTLGGPGDMWGAVLTSAIVNDAAFGVYIAGVGPSGCTLSVQNVVVQIYYTLASTVMDGTVEWTDITPTMLPSAQAGTVPFGLRYMIVMFLNRNGYISGWSPASVVNTNLPDSLHQIDVTFPTGPENTIARILAFTPAGQLGQQQGFGISSAGPYFWIEPNFPNSSFAPNSISPLAEIPGGVTVADVVSGVTMNSTLINDNVTTSATFNFTDDYLKATLNDVSDYFRKIQIPGCSDVYFSQVLGRMFYATDNLQSGWYVSLEDDPESVYGDTGLFEAAENNGENRTAVRDFAGVCYAMKEKSGYVIAPNAGDPSTWDDTPQWSGSGPCGPRAVDVATNFMCYLHRSGVYIFEGGQPYRISKEIPISFSNINWTVQQLFWVMIDDETREIRIGVAYGESLVPNLVLKCNYEELPSWSPPSFAPPIHFSPYMGKEIAAGGCYKWSIDDISANYCIRAERQLLPPPAGFPLGFDIPTIQSQVLYASSNPDGAVAAIIPGTLDDNGVGIDSQAETACPVIMNGDGKVVKSLMGPSRLGGVQLNVDGAGRGGVFVLGLRAKDPKQGGPPLAGKSKANVGAEIRLKKPWMAGIPYSCGGTMTNERMRLRITNDKIPGNGFDLKWACLFAQPITTARPS